nr:MAG TPA: hypothetical protein [Crassvirales sp.]
MALRLPTQLFLTTKGAPIGGHLFLLNMLFTLIYDAFISSLVCLYIS